MEQLATQRPDQKTGIEIIECGRLGDLAWDGAVSADEMIAGGRTSDGAIDEAVRRLDDFYVSADLDAKTRCIDGRHDPKLDESSLGPQVPGGAPGAALAYRLGVASGNLESGTFLEDAESMIASYARVGFSPGGHRDEASHGQTMVGCGAIDGMDRIVATMMKPSLVNDHKRVVELLLGERFDNDDYLAVMGAATLINGRSESYFRNREKIIDTLEEQSPESTAVLKGKHQECLVAVNLIPETTFASNRFAEEFDGVQAFGYDLWWSVEIAERLMPRPDQVRDRARFIMARVITTVATLMALTDGSQRLILRAETPATEE